MSQMRKPYQVKGIAAEVRPDTLAPFAAWAAPTPGEIRAALQAAGWTGEGCAKTAVLQKGHEGPPDKHCHAGAHGVASGHNPGRV